MVGAPLVDDALGGLPGDGGVGAGVGAAGVGVGVGVTGVGVTGVGVTGDGATGVGVGAGAGAAGVGAIGAVGMAGVIGVAGVGDGVGAPGCTVGGSGAWGAVGVDPTGDTAGKIGVTGVELIGVSLSGLLAFDGSVADTEGDTGPDPLPPATDFTAVGSISCSECPSSVSVALRSFSASSGVLTTCGVKKTSSSVRLLRVDFERNRLPSRGISPRIGTLYAVSVSVLLIIPPSTTVCPSLTLAVVFASRWLTIGASSVVS